MTLQALQDAITVDGVHKWYRVYAAPGERIKRLFGRPSRHLDFRALEDVTFGVEPGTAVGIIGENGAGKSTLLKIIAGTTTPTAGSVDVRGVVAAILELGAAFHPEFSGRENAVLYGALMGLDKAEMEARLDDIFAFAELGEFVEHPVKSYSTGMAMRLAFAVATHVDPDVLVVDEALAVGDGYFQKKCVDRIREIRDRGTTILFCSHSMYYVSLFCRRALWLRNGRIEMDGPAQEVVNAYEEFLITREKRRLDTQAEDGGVENAGPPGQQARIRGIRVFGANGEPAETYTPGMELVVELEWEAVDPKGGFHVGVSLDRGDGTRVVAVATFVDGLPTRSGAGVRRDRVRIQGLPLAKGNYSVTGYIFDPSALHIWDQAVITDCLRPQDEGWSLSLLKVDHRWELDGETGVSPGGAEIRVARDGDENGIIEGLNRCRDRPLSLEEWSWSYPPSVVGRPIVVAVKEGRIVAHVGGVVSAIRIDGRSVPALAMADEFALAEVGGDEEKDRLLAEVLQTWKREFGGADRKWMFYQLVGEGESSGSSAFTAGQRVALPPVEVLARRVAVRAPVRRLAFRAEPARDWEPRLDDLWRRVARFYPFAAVRDAEMSLHRHAGHPGTRRHRFLVFPRFSRHAVAWAVFETDASRCRWVDLVWDHDEPGALDLLAHLSRRLASQVGAMNERIVLGGDADARARLEALGFRPEGGLEDLSLTVFSMPQMLRPADLESRFYATQTDLDPLRRMG